MSGDEESEERALILTEEQEREDSESLSTKQEEQACQDLTKCREYLLLGVLLFSQFVALCTDTFLFPFFPQEAKSKGLTHVEIGTIFSSFEFARFMTAPVLGYLVNVYFSNLLKYKVTLLLYNSLCL